MNNSAVVLPNEITDMPSVNSSRDGSDASVLLGDEAGNVIGRCSLWWSSTPLLEGLRTGYIGHFEATGVRAGEELLNLACRRLALQKCQVAIGPIDGSTWNRYRFVTKGGDELAPFFWEPENPGAYPSMFSGSGFSILAKYYSTITEACSRPADLDRYRTRLNSAGVTVRGFNPTLIDDELRSLYEISVVSFAGNFLYQSIAESEFLAMYKPLIPMLDPRLILVAEVEQRPVGYILFVPDKMDVAGGARSVIAKTAARLPEKSLAGLGSLLLLEAEQIAADLGYEKIIHALMHEENTSLRICTRYGKVFREYGLFHKRI